MTVDDRSGQLLNARGRREALKKAEARALDTLRQMIEQAIADYTNDTGRTVKYALTIGGPEPDEREEEP